MVETIYGPLIQQYDELLHGIISPLLAEGEHQVRELDQMAVLTICKFCCLSERYCQQNIGILLRLLK